MARHWCYFLFMIWFTYLIISSILLFSKGLLLSRVTQERNSSCIHYEDLPCPLDKSSKCNENRKFTNVIKDYENVTRVCLPKKSKVILLIVDALRYDFTVMNESNTDPLPFQNKLPIISELKRNYPENTRLYKAIADPPTTTMQRLKALTTGSLPTFIDAGSNFATQEITEDNIIDQVVKNNLKAVFMGDDTWNKLYPNRFHRNHPYPSFYVWDLDTVDNGVKSHIFDEINKGDWDLLIGHFLGVDHCGHRYGPKHPEMARKLTEINDVIKQVTEQIDNESVLFVIGDHGMTGTGDHGGVSSDEISTGFFVYSKQQLFSTNHVSSTIKQISIVPTIATLLGIPIPFSNLGTIIVDSIPMKNSSDWLPLLYSIWANAHQMMSYIIEYSNKDREVFSTQKFEEMQTEFRALRNIIADIPNDLEFGYFIGQSNDFMTGVRENCEEVWTKFDSFSMTRGLLIFFSTIFSSFIIVDGISLEKLPVIFRSSFVPSSYLILFCTIVGTTALFYLEIIDNLIYTIFFATGIVSQLLLGLLVVQNWELISLNWYNRSKTEKIPNIITRAIMVFSLCGFFSNSFILEESFILMFMLNSVILIGTWNVIQYEGKKKFDFKSKIKLILIAAIIALIVRVSMIFWQCREEQQWCFEHFADFNGISSKTETTKMQWLITVICLALFVISTKVWLKNCGNLNGYSITITLAKYIPTTIIICTSGYWVLNRLPVNTRNKLVPYSQVDILVWIVYFLIFAGILSTVIRPLCIFIANDKKISVSNEDVIPDLYKHVKKLFNEPKKDDIPMVYGLGTVYSATYIIIGVYLTLLIALLQGDAVAPSSVIMFSTAAFILIILSVIRLKQNKELEKLFQFSNMYIFIWVILSHYFFYGTGHQPSFPNIDWNAAFIGTSGIFSYQFIPASLIIINTFSSYILIGFFLPLLVIIPFTITIILPSFIKKDVWNGENRRGEVILYEKDSLFMTSLFTLSCKYMMMHALRVFASMLAATIHCRHLMVWNIFAPKFIFESLAMFVTLLIVNFSYLILIWINASMRKLFVYLNKRYS